MENITKKSKNQIKVKTTKTTKLNLITLMIVLIFTLPVFSQGTTCEADSSLIILEQKLEQSRYSGFQKRMISEAAEKLLTLDINTRETEKLLIISVDNNFDPYNIKKIIELLVDAKSNGISEKSLINKFKEGLAKRVDERLIVEVLLKEYGNLKVAKNIVLENPITEALYEASYDEEKIVESLAEGLNNGVPRDSLSEVFSRSVREGRNPREVTDVSTELGNLSLRAYEIGLSEEEVNEVFERAVLSRSGVDGVCEDIQEMLIAATISKMNMQTGKSSGGSGETVSPTGTITGETGTSSTSIISAPTSGTSTPIAADDKPDIPTKPESDSSAPPEN